MIVSEIYPQHWTVLVSFFGIKAVLLYTVVYSVFFFLRRKLAVWIWNFRKVKGHTIIIGINEESRSFVNYFINKDHKVAVIEENKENPDIQSIEDQGALVVLGNPEDENILKKSRLINAGKVMVATSNESKNINIAESISKHVSENSDSSNKTEVLVRVESDNLRTVLEKRWKVIESPDCVFRIINFQSTAIREIISEIAIDLCGEEKFRKQGPRFLIVADSPLSDDLLRQAIQFVQISGESVPSFTVPNEEPEDESYFRSRYPDIDLVADVNFINCPKDRIANSEMFAEQSFDALIVSLEDELGTIGLTYELLDSNSLNVDKGFAILRESQKIKMKHHERLRIMSLTDHGKKSPEFGDFDMEKEAEDTHNTHLLNLEKAKRSVTKEWGELDYATKESNRMAVLHHRVKRKIWEFTKKENKDKIISLLACSEHQRWKAERIFSGWKGGDRDDERKIHDNICPYSEVPDKVKEYDFPTVKKALGLN
ncbi:MAG: NAD-binding protein [bacterium]